MDFNYGYGYGYYIFRNAQLYNTLERLSANQNQALNSINYHIWNSYVDLEQELLELPILVVVTQFDYWKYSVET